MSCDVILVNYGPKNDQSWWKGFDKIQNGKLSFHSGNFKFLKVFWNKFDSNSNWFKKKSLILKEFITNNRKRAFDLLPFIYPV